MKKNKGTGGAAKIFLAITGTVLVLAIIFCAPVFSGELVKVEEIAFATKTVKDAGLELGESKVSHSGTPGQKWITYRYSRSLSHILFRKKPTELKRVSSRIGVPPVDKVVVTGIKKYQYVWCSNGSYRYYTDEQFKGIYTGFTSESADVCAENGQGKMLRVADSPPSAQNAPNAVPYNNSSRSPVVETHDLGPPLDLTESMRYQPLEYNPPLLKNTPLTPHKITVPSPTPKPPTCFYYQGNGGCFSQ